MCLPDVIYVPPCVIAIHMGEPCYDGYYDGAENRIYVNVETNSVFITLLHEIIHWILSTPPHIEFVWMMNLWYDWVWDMLFNR